MTIEDDLDAIDADQISPSSVPMFPPIRRARTPKRVLAYYTKGNIYTEIGKKFTVSDWGDLYDLMFRENLCLFVESLSDYDDFKFLYDCIIDPRASVACSKKGIAIGVILSYKNNTRWIVQFSTWNLEPGIVSILQLRKLMNYIGMGDYHTPARLGRELMYHVWRMYQLPRHTQPNGFCCEFLKKNQSGGRVDTPGLGKHYDEVIEIDMSSAYLSNFMVHPTGTSVPWHNTRYAMHREFPVWFGECLIDIMEDLPLGPFPVRKYDELDRFKTIDYPTKKGTYRTYIWSSTAEVCEKYNCRVDPIAGYGWYELTADNALWSNLAYLMKKNAEYDFVEDMWKQCIVAAIGSHGMNQVFYELVPEEEADLSKDRHFTSDREAFDWVIVEKRNLSQPRMSHWFGSTLARTSNDVFSNAYKYARENRLVATNYDSIIFEIRDLQSDTGHYVSRTDARSVPAGTWRWEILHDVDIIAPRSLKSREKTILPGVDRKDR